MWKDGHLFGRIPCGTVLFNGKRLRELRMKYWHPNSQKLHNLMKRGGKDVTSNDFRLLEKIGRECLLFQKYAKETLGYAAAILEDVIFNHEIVMDIMIISRKMVLQIVDIGTNFTAARFIRDKTSE